MKGQIEVWHRIQPTFMAEEAPAIDMEKYRPVLCVDYVHMPETARARAECAESFWTWTNSVDAPWWDPERWKKSKPLRLRENSRSTSVGDLVLFCYEDGRIEPLEARSVGFAGVKVLWPGLTPA